MRRRSGVRRAILAFLLLLALLFSVASDPTSGTQVDLDASASVVRTVAGENHAKPLPPLSSIEGLAMALCVAIAAAIALVARRSVPVQAERAVVVDAATRRTAASRRGPPLTA
jgi:hypothetical protein